MTFPTRAKQASICGQPPFNITHSQGTDVSEPLPLSKQISLSSCASSLSICQDLPYSRQNQLFARYLADLGTTRESLAFGQLRKHFELVLEAGTSVWLECFKEKEEVSEEEDRVLEHFIAVWMRFMGYGSNANKRYFMYRVKFMSSPEMISRLTKVYRNLNLLGMSRPELRSFLLNTCKQGWEYFVRGILSNLRLLQLKVR